MEKAYKFRIYPNKEQEALIQKTLGYKKGNKANPIMSYKVIHYSGSVFAIREVISIHHFDHFPEYSEMNAIAKFSTPYVREIKVARGTVIDFGSHSEFLYVCDEDTVVSKGMEL